MLFTSFKVVVKLLEAVFHGADCCKLVGGCPDAYSIIKKSWWMAFIRDLDLVQVVGLLKY